MSPQPKAKITAGHRRAIHTLVAGRPAGPSPEAQPTAARSCDPPLFGGDGGLPEVEAEPVLTDQPGIRPARPCSCSQPLRNHRSFAYKPGRPRTAWSASLS